MSFLGSIGMVMTGSGLSEVLEQCFGPNAVLHMLSSKAVSRAQRGRFLVDATLGIMLIQRVTSEKGEYDCLQSFSFSPEDMKIIFQEYKTVMEDGLQDSFPSASLLELETGLSMLKNELMQKSRTAKL